MENKEHFRNGDITRLEIMFLSAVVDAEVKGKPGSHLVKRRLTALEQSFRQMLFYVDKGILFSIIERACQKKFDAVLAATTVSELDTIVHSPKPRDYGGKFIDNNPYGFDEEELIQWSLATLKAPPSRAIVERIEVLFERVFGATLDSYINH